MHVPQLEEIDQLLLRVSGLVDAIEDQYWDAADRVRGWLYDTEAAFQRDGLAAVSSRMAGLRAELLVLLLGGSPPGFPINPQTNSRRLRQVGLLHVVQEGERSASTAVEDVRVTFAETQRMLRQIVVVARHKTLPDADPPGPGSESALRRLWLAIISDPDMTAAATRVLGLVSESDALALLDQSVSIP